MLISILFGYWQITWILAIILLFLIQSYYEIILWGIIYDALYGMALPGFWNIKYIFTISSIVLFVVSVLIKKRLIAYRF